jgi:hypothetical protein
MRLLGRSGSDGEEDGDDRKDGFHFDAEMNDGVSNPKYFMTPI